MLSQRYAENLGGDDVCLDRNEKMKFGARTMQKGDSMLLVIQTSSRASAKRETRDPYAAA
jgi:hypothetical protein